VLIDLGDMTTTDDRVAVRPRWTLPVYGPKAIVAALVAIVALGGLGRSEPAPAGPLAFVGSVPISTDAQFLVSGARAVLLDLSNSGASISGYALPGTHRVWTQPLTAAAIDASMFVEGSTVVLDEPLPGNGDAVWQSGGQRLDQGFDLRSGRRLWSYPSDLVWPTPAGLLIAVETVLPPYALPAPGAVGPAGVELVDPATGAIRWSLPMAAECTVVPATDDGGPMVNGLIEMCPATQELVGIDLATGHVRARRQVDLAGLTSPYVETIQPELLFEGSVVVAAIQDRTRIVLSAFRTSDFAPLWSGYPVGAGVDVSPCDAYLCIDDGSGRAVAVDPWTGVKAALAPDEPGRCCNAATSFRARFGIAEVIVVPPGQHPVLPSYPVSIDFEPLIAAGQALDPTTPATPIGDRLWVGEQVRHGDTVDVAMLGSLTGVGESCLAVEGDRQNQYLACTTSAGRLSFWKLG
jgi:outer membrane protein assembly factor BamB